MASGLSTYLGSYDTDYDKTHRALSGISTGNGMTSTDNVKPCHHFLYSGGAFVRLYPVNPSTTTNHAVKTKMRLSVRYKMALDMWALMPVPYSRLKSPRM